MILSFETVIFLSGSLLHFDTKLIIKRFLLWYNYFLIKTKDGYLRKQLRLDGLNIIEFS